MRALPERDPRIAVWTIKLLLGGLLVYAGVVKLLDPSAFAEEIANYRFLPQLAPMLAVVLPPVEIALGTVLIGARPKNPWLGAAALGSALLMAVFTVAVTQAVLRGIDTNCGCFGTDSGPITWFTVMRVVGLGVVSGWLARA